MVLRPEAFASYNAISAHFIKLLIVESFSHKDIPILAVFFPTLKTF